MNPSTMTETQLLLPSYNTATQENQPVSTSTSTSKRISTSATIVIQRLTALIFTGTAIISTAWAHQTYQFSDPTPPEKAPLLPYFAFLCIIISFSTWIGYLIFIYHDWAGGPRLQREIIIYTSVIGKVVLGGIHVGVWLWYGFFFTRSKQPNWAVVFLAAQAWWDWVLFVVYEWLKVVG